MKPMVIPEILEGFEINWDKYVMPCGNDFGNSLHTTVVKALGETLAVCRRNQESFATCVSAASSFVELFRRTQSEMDEVSGKIRGAIASSKEIQERMLGPDEHEIVCPDEADLAWVDGAHCSLQSLIDWGNGIRDWKAHIAKINDDMAFLNDLITFFQKDQTFDVLMYATAEIEVKYRTKVFREAHRIFNEIMVLMSKIKSSPSAIKDMTLSKDHVIGQAWAFLLDTYGTVPVMVKRIKKELDRRGNEFWDEWSYHGPISQKDVEVAQSIIRRMK